MRSAGIAQAMKGALDPLALAGIEVVPGGGAISVTRTMSGTIRVGGVDFVTHRRAPGIGWDFPGADEGWLLSHRDGSWGLTIVTR